MLHQLNIIVHIIFGTLALLVGLGPLLSAKGGARHVRFGGWFLGLAGVALVTAVLGLVVFRFRPFLTVIVLLSVYQAYAGYRVLHIRQHGPAWHDSLLAALFLAAGVAFWLLLPRIRLVWSPVVMYSTLGALLAVTGYDLSRIFWRARWRQSNAWRYEHIWKMVSTYSALLSAFSGTVLVAYQPYSQFVPSLLGTAVAVGFFMATYHQQHPAAVA